MKEINVEFLLGKRVVDPEGRTIGRIHEIRAERGVQSCAVEAYLVGGRAILLRIASWALPAHLGAGLKSRFSRPFGIRWDQMDLSDPAHPRTTVAKDELRRSG